MPTHRAMKPRLMVMMFLQFFVWGAWYATGGNCPIGSIVAPFFLGMIADRVFPVQRVLGVLHVLVS
jgi:hypothetical protein